MTIRMCKMHSCINHECGYSSFLRQFWKLPCTMWICTFCSFTKCMNYMLVSIAGQVPVARHNSQHGCPGGRCSPSRKSLCAHEFLCKVMNFELLFVCFFAGSVLCLFDLVAFFFFCAACTAHPVALFLVDISCSSRLLFLTSVPALLPMHSRQTFSLAMDCAIHTINISEDSWYEKPQSADNMKSSAQGGHTAVCIAKIFSSKVCGQALKTVSAFLW